GCGSSPRSPDVRQADWRWETTANPTAAAKSTTIAALGPTSCSASVTKATPSVVPRPRAMLTKPPPTPEQAAGSAAITLALLAGVNRPRPIPSTAKEIASTGSVKDNRHNGI